MFPRKRRIVIEIINGAIHYKGSNVVLYIARQFVSIFSLSECKGDNLRL